MDKLKFEEIIHKLELKKEEWMDLDEIESIVLKDGRGIYPNWKYLRFLIKPDLTMLIQHGKCEPYGDRLASEFIVSYDRKTFSFKRDNVLSELSGFKPFRLPIIGDFICSTDGDKLISEAVIVNVVNSSNMFIIDTSMPLKPGRLSFYSATNRSWLDMHSTHIEGKYMKFCHNDGKTDKKYGFYNEVIKFKEIKEINLKIGSKKYKTFKIE